jgi:hypothetical protein
MKAEERKEIETNSLVHAVQWVRERTTGRTLYYLAGTIAIVIGAVLLYRYLTGERSRVRDASLIQLVSADTTEKLKQGMEEHRGTLLGSIFKLQLARHYLLNEGLPKLGTDKSDEKNKAANAVAEGRNYFLELTNELKQKDEPALVEEAWHAAAKAEEALVGFPTAEGGSDSRGNVDKVIEYYEKSASIFPDTEFSKRDKASAEKIKANKDQFVAAQKAIYKQREQPLMPPPPKKDDPFGSVLPGLPKTDPALPKIELPPPPTGDVQPPVVPPAPTPPVTPDPKKSPDPKPADKAKADPKAK